jgi:hypothetical protein
MKRHARSFWVGLLEEVAAGRSVVEVARRHRVRERTLRWWQWKLGRAEIVSQRLLPVVVAPTRMPTHVVVAAGASSLHVEVGTDIAYVAALARALREAC